MSTRAGTPHLQVLTLSGAGSSPFAIVDPQAFPFAISLAAYVSSGADLTYTVEHTLETVQYPSDSATVLPNILMTAKTASAESNYFVPVSAIRLTVNSWTSGSVSLYIRQSGGQL